MVTDYLIQAFNMEYQNLINDLVVYLVGGLGLTLFGFVGWFARNMYLNMEKLSSVINNLVTQHSSNIATCGERHTGINGKMIDLQEQIDDHTDELKEHAKDIVILKERTRYGK